MSVGQTMVFAAAAGLRVVMDNDHLPPLLSILYSSHSQLADLLV